MEGEALVPIEPLTHLRVLVSGVVVENHVDARAGGDPTLDRIQEANELLMAMALRMSLITVILLIDAEFRQLEERAALQFFSNLHLSSQ